MNLRGSSGQAGDLEEGVDFIPFDDLSTIRLSRAVPLTRNHRARNPHAGNQWSLMVKYPMRGGFVPAGAAAPGGSPHPNAGTGFTLNQAIAWPIGGSMEYRSERSFWKWELRQVEFDGTDFRVTRTETLSLDALFPGWIMRDGGLSNAIPHGDELLLPMSGWELERGEQPPNNPLARLSGAGVLRWRRTRRVWMPSDYVPVTPYDGSRESSLVADGDSFLFAVRGLQEDTHHDVRVWWSSDGARTWKLLLRAPNIICQAPVTINSAADGTPYVCANYQPSPGSHSRETLALFPLSPDRARLDPPLIARDSRADFGRAPGGGEWKVDHPISAVVQLADGAWHNVLCYRVMDEKEYFRAMGPTPYTGAYVEEVTSSGRALPRWTF